MNKTLKTILIVALCLFGVGMLTLIGTSIVTGYKLTDIGTAAGEAEVLPDKNVQTIEKVISEDSQDIDIDLSFADIIVEKSTDADIHISYPESSKVHFELREYTGKIAFSQEQNKISFWGLYSAPVQVRLLIPAKHEGSLKIDTASGSIELGSVSITGDFDFSTASGRISADGCSCGKSDFSTASGSVELSALDTSALEIGTASGSIEIDDIKSEPVADLSSTSGSIRVTSSEFSELDAATNSGAVALEDLTSKRCAAENTSGPCELENVVADELRVKTISGSIRGTLAGTEADYTITARTTSGQNSLLNLGGHGSKTLTVATTSGDIGLEFIG